MMIQLDEPTTGHAEALASAVRESLSDLEPWMSWATNAYGLADAERWIAEARTCRSEGSAYQFFIGDSDGQLLGTCGLNRIDAANHFANLGYWIRSSASGRSIAPRAVEQLAHWAFAHTALHRLEIVVALGNTRSQRVAEKAGAIHEGVLRARLWLHGAPRDAVLYSLVRTAPPAQAVPPPHP